MRHFISTLGMMFQFWAGVLIFFAMGMAVFSPVLLAVWYLTR